MILCIDSTALKTSPDVQKDVNLGDLMTNHTKYYETVEEALKDKFVPLDFSVTVRSMYSNLVLMTTKESGNRFYTNLSQIERFVHKGYDLVMYLTSIGMMYNIDYKFGFDDLMMKHSQFQPIGIYNPNPSVVNPIVYSHIILSDEGAELLPNFLKGDRKLVPISTMKEFSEGNIQALLDTIIEVKEDKSDEQCDHD